LIGAEVNSMCERFPGEQAITIVAGKSLADRYQQALSAVGRRSTFVSGDAAFQAGIRSIAHAVAN
jgi:2-dehydro-3-deoxygalactonokinase